MRRVAACAGFRRSNFTSARQSLLRCFDLGMNGGSGTGGKPILRRTGVACFGVVRWSHIPRIRFAPDGGGCARSIAPKSGRDWTHRQVRTACARASAWPRLTRPAIRPRRLALFVRAARRFGLNPKQTKTVEMDHGVMECQVTRSPRR